MTYWEQNYFFALGISVLLAGIIIPKILLIAFRKKLFDTIDERKVHQGAVPRLGGMAFLPSLTFAFCIVIGFNVQYYYFDIVPALKHSIAPIAFLICALMLIYLCGLADDLIGVRYRAKFMMQILGGALIIASGLWIHDLYGFMWIHALPDWIGWIITIFSIIYVVNAVNLIDGIDGLASGLSAVALIWFSYIFYIGGNYTCLLLAGATLGTQVPFFYYNVFGHAADRTKVFMGDTGSLTIGMILVFLSIEVFSMTPESTPGNENMFILAVSPLLVPCFDVARVFMHRVRMGRNPFLPDKCHIHHKLLALGIVQWKALVVILMVDMLVVMMNVLLSPVLQPTLIIAGDLVLWFLFNMTLTRMIRARERKIGAVLYD